MTLLLFILIIWLIYLLFGGSIKRWLIRRAIKSMGQRFGFDPGDQTKPQDEKGRQQSEVKEEKINMSTLTKRKFGKDQGEFVDYEDVT